MKGLAVPPTIRLIRSRLGNFAGQVIDLQGSGGGGGKRRKSAVVPDQVYSQGRQCADNRGHQVLRCQGSPEGWQAHGIASVVESTRVARGRVYSGTCLYLGGINDTPGSWRGGARSRCSGRRHATADAVAAFQKTAARGGGDASIVHVKLSQLRCAGPRGEGAFGLALMLWRETASRSVGSKRLRSTAKERAAGIGFVRFS